MITASLARRYFPHPPWVKSVAHFDVLEHLPPHGVPGLETLAMDRLDTQAMEEALGARIVLAVALGSPVVRQVVLDH